MTTEKRGELWDKFFPGDIVDYSVHGGHTRNRRARILKLVSGVGWDARYMLHGVPPDLTREFMAHAIFLRLVSPLQLLAECIDD